MWQYREKGGDRFFDSLVPGRRGGSRWITVHLLRGFCFVTLPNALSFLKKIFIFSIIVDLQCSVYFCCTAVTQSYIYIYIYTHTHILFLTLSSIMFHHSWLDIVPSATQQNLIVPSAFRICLSLPLAVQVHCWHLPQSLFQGTQFSFILFFLKQKDSIWHINSFHFKEVPLHAREWLLNSFLTVFKQEVNFEMFNFTLVFEE